MAQKRMFSLKIVDTDAFLDMPQSTQNLYFHLGMRADDEGFIGNVKRIMKMIGSSEDDKKVLLAKKFLIEFESGVVVIKHWKMNNYLQNDRIKETAYLQEKSTLYLKDNGSYTLDSTQGTPLYTKCIHSIDKNRLDLEENRLDNSEQVAKPTEKNSDALSEILEAEDFEQELKDKIILWLQYKKEKKSGYKPTGFKVFLKDVKKSVEKHGKDYTLQRFDYSMSKNYQGVFFETSEKQVKVEQESEYKRRMKNDTSGFYG